MLSGTAIISASVLDLEFNFCTLELKMKFPTPVTHVPEADLIFSLLAKAASMETVLPPRRWPSAGCHQNYICIRAGVRVRLWSDNSDGQLSELSVRVDFDKSENSDICPTYPTVRI